jgi:hypothetical protein
MDIEIITPSTAVLPLDHILVALTEEIDKLEPALVAHGCLGGEHGYGGRWDSHVFAMRPYYWGDCDCGGDAREDEWCAAHSHSPECYQTELEAAERSVGVHYTQTPSQKMAYEKAEKLRKDIYKRLCKKFKRSYPSGCAVHCTCSYEKDWLEFSETHGHTKQCAIVLPNFLYKPTGFEVRWYKWIGRSMETRGATPDLGAMLKECMADVQARRASDPQSPK